MSRLIAASTLALLLSGCILVPVGHRHSEGQPPPQQQAPGEHHEDERRDDDRRCDHDEHHDCREQHRD